MKDEELILKWNELKNKKYAHESVTIDEIDAFNKLVQESYNNGEISLQMGVKYVELICYLSD